MEEIYSFAGNPLDRASQRRQDAGWVASLLENPQSRLLPLDGLKPQIRDASAVTLDWQSLARWRPVIDGGNTLIFLGLRDGLAYFALDATGAQIPCHGEGVTMDARAAAPLIRLHRQRLERLAERENNQDESGSTKQYGGRQQGPVHACT